MLFLYNYLKLKINFEITCNDPSPYAKKSLNNKDKTISVLKNLYKLLLPVPILL